MKNSIRIALAVALAAIPAMARAGAVPPPVAGFTASPTFGVAPLSVNFTDMSSGVITNWFWDFGDATTTNTTVTSLLHAYQFPGTYSVELTVSGPGGVGSDMQHDYITVIPEPSTLLLVGVGLCLFVVRIFAQPPRRSSGA